MYSIIRKILFLFPPETAHYLALDLLKLALKIPLLSQIIVQQYRLKSPKLEKNVFGIRFPNPVGLAAGLDKNARYYKELSKLGFGFIEIGTVTPKPQAGNPKPRLFRIKKDKAIINRMGFNNDGVDAVVKRLQSKPAHIIIGGNIGKNKTTPNEKAVDDYLICFHKLFDYVDYFVVNVSSPNTPGLRSLQERKPLERILSALQKANNEKNNPKPILLKIAPDLSSEQIDEIIDIVTTTQISGIIATNTTIARNNLSLNSQQIEAIGNGGLSGAPLTEASTKIIRYIRSKNPNIPVIGVGGIMHENDACEKIKAGADLVQLYSGFVYEGPALIKKIKQKIINNEC
ncbi:MAG: quinone-dependent dihydroorotate dehydrogenase [Bacteroidetes bacterium]|nr:MAG: quinone-dependent dihydroorotate dehydrogenase [Bacteroidota bacterium]